LFATDFIVVIVIAAAVERAVYRIVIGASARCAAAQLASSPSQVITDSPLTRSQRLAVSPLPS